MMKMYFIASGPLPVGYKEDFPKGTCFVFDSSSKCFSASTKTEKKEYYILECVHNPSIGIVANEKSEIISLIKQGILIPYKQEER